MGLPTERDRLMSEESRINIGDLRPGDVALLRDLAETAAESAVKKTFIAMGLDPADPINAQRDFSFLRDMVARAHDQDFSADLNWVRRTRQRSEGLVGKVFATALGIAVIGALHAMWVGFQSLVGTKP